MAKKIEYKKVDILLDFDFKPKDLEKFAKELANKMSFIDFVFETTFTKCKVRETNKGLHIYLEAIAPNQLNPVDIVVIQLALGSDYKRELFNYRRVKDKVITENWNILFKRKTTRDVEGNVKYESKEVENENTKKLQKLIMQYYLDKLIGHCKEIREMKTKEFLAEKDKKYDWNDLFRFLM